MSTACEPVKTLEGEHPVEVADILREEYGDREHPQIDAVNSELVHHRPESSTGKILVELGEVVGRGIEAARAQATLGCGQCALRSTCKVTSNLTAYSLAGLEATQQVEKIIKAREKAEDNSEIRQIVHSWYLSKKEADSRQTRGEVVDENDLRLSRICNENRAKLLFRISSIDPGKRDQAIRDSFAVLPQETKNYALANGLVDGIVTELYVFEQLKALEGTNGVKTVQMSTVDQDIKDGVDFVVATTKGQIFYFDAKTTLKPDHKPLGKGKSSYFAQKREPTRKGEPVFMISPNSRELPKSYIGTTEIGYARVASFSNTTEQMSSEFRDLIAQFIQALEKRNLGSKPTPKRQKDGLGGLPSIS